MRCRLPKEFLTPILENKQQEMFFCKKHKVCYNRIDLAEYRKWAETETMKFYKKLYTGKSIKNPNKIKWKLRHGRLQPGVYVIALASGTDQLEIYHSAFLKQSYYKVNPPYIVGIAGGYEEAVQMVIELVQTVVEETGSPDLKKYLFPETSKR